MILELAGLSRRFGGVVAVDGVTLAVGEGELLGLIGPNGAGKTTLLDMVSGFQTVDAGTVRLGGRDVTRSAPHRRARLGLARTFQTSRLFRGLDARGNVLAGMHARRRDDTVAQLALLPRTRRAAASREAEAARLLDLVGLAGLERTPAAALPYGHQRRLEIARALAVEPAVLLLDEPVAGMGATESQSVRGLLERLRRRGLTMVLVEHHLDLVLELCDRVAVLDFGRLIALGPPDDVVRDPAVVEAYLGRAGARRAG